MAPSGSQGHHGSIGISIAIKLFQDSKNLKPFRIFKSQNSFMMAKPMAPARFLLPLNFSKILKT